MRHCFKTECQKFPWDSICCRMNHPLASITKVWPLPGQDARHTSAVANVKIALSENNVLLLHPRVDAVERSWPSG